MSSLARRLGTRDAVVIGLGSMIGAGVFAAFAPAAEAAGSGLLLGLALAAGVAFCNATASAQLAAQYPTSGGTYVYGRERLGEWWGFVAGWGFVIGKTGSCAAMALTFASYAVHGSLHLQRAVALLAVLALTAVNLRGITRTAALARVLVALSIASLLVVVIAIATSGRTETAHLDDLPFGTGGAHGIFQAAALLFFAFAGYARIATLGEEVREPERTIPRAIPIALGIVVVLYAVVAVAALLAAGPEALAASTAPLVTAVDAVGAAWASPIVRIGAVVASLGSLLALVAGLGRTSLAMARNGDLPRWLAAVHPRHQVPHHAEIAIGAGGCAARADDRPARRDRLLVVRRAPLLRGRERIRVDAGPAHRRWPRWLNVVGGGACIALVAALPLSDIVAGVVVLAVGVAGRAVLRRRRPR